MPTIEDYYPLGQEGHDQKLPIIVKTKNNDIFITAVFRYNRLALKPWLINGLCQADLIEAAISRYWSGTYKIRSKKYKGYIKGQVHVKIIRRICSDEITRTEQGDLCRGKDKYKHRQAVLIRVRPIILLPAHVISPWYRRYWGIFRTGQLESIGTNWSRKYPGVMNLPPCSPTHIRAFERIAAHEAGHLFGVGDAYAAIYRFYHAAPGTENFMMRSNRRVHAREITMLLEAQQQNKMQFFVKKWDFVKFKQGFKQDLAYRSAEIERNLSKIWEKWKNES